MGFCTSWQGNQGLRHGPNNDNNNIVANSASVSNDVIGSDSGQVRHLKAEREVFVCTHSGSCHQLCLSLCSCCHLLCLLCPLLRLLQLLLRGLQLLLQVAQALPVCVCELCNRLGLQSFILLHTTPS